MCAVSSISPVSAAVLFVVMEQSGYDDDRYSCPLKAFADKGFAEQFLQEKRAEVRRVEIMHEVSDNLLLAWDAEHPSPDYEKNDSLYGDEPILTAYDIHQNLRTEEEIRLEKATGYDKARDALCGGNGCYSERDMFYYIAEVPMG